MTHFSQPSTSQAQTMADEDKVDQAERMALKANYMSLLEEANAIGGNPNVRESITQINSLVDRANVLLDSVKDTKSSSEFYLDARVLHSVTTALEQTTNSVDVGEGVFHLFTFAEQFRSKATSGGGMSEWESLAAVAKPVVHNSIPTWSPLLGSFEYSAEVEATQQRKKKVHHQKDKIVDKKEPEKLSQLDKRQDSVEEVVQSIFVKLKKYYRENHKKPINYFKFVVNPTSFSATVENIFHVSFLVNDGFVKLELDGDEPTITPLSSGKENSNPQNLQQESKIKKQNIISIDVETWQDLVDSLEIKEAII